MNERNKELEDEVAMLKQKVLDFKGRVPAHCNVKLKSLMELLCSP